MNRTVMQCIKTASLAFLLSLGMVSLAMATSLPETGIVVMATGHVSAESNDKQKRDLNRRSPVFVGDKLSTGDNAQVQLRMKDGAVIALGPNAEFFIGAYSDDKSGDKKDAAVLKLMQGGLRTITGSIDKSSYKLETPIATLGIRGTVYDVYVKGDGTTTVVLRDGGVNVTGDTGVVQRLDLVGLAVVVERGKAPSKPGPVPTEVLNYLKQFLPDVPDNVTWQGNDDGSTSFNIGDDVINMTNMPLPTTTGDGSVPGITEDIVHPATPSGCDPMETMCSCSECEIPNPLD